MEFELPVIANGTLEKCPHQGCDHTCCEFVEGNFIALYPGEVQAAHLAGKSLDHLSITADGNGGHRAICHASDKSRCDEGYKPLDCASYPLFPAVNADGEIEITLKGAKCPLQPKDVVAHRDWVLARWNEVRNTAENLANWIRLANLVGYENLH